MSAGLVPGQKVFVSHTSELAAWPRPTSCVQTVLQAVVRAHFEPVEMDLFPAQDKPPAQVCREAVLECAAYVAVIGFRYGSLVSGRDVSYTELEFETATAAGIPRIVVVLSDPPADESLVDIDRTRIDKFRHRVKAESRLTVKEVNDPSRVEFAVMEALKALREASGVAGRLRSAQLGSLDPTAYLTLLAESYRWLPLQGIREAGSLRIELEKVYVALKAEPESEYDLGHLAALHDLEVREAAGTAPELIEPTRRAALDAENVRRTHRPREEARRSSSAEAQNVADVFRRYNRIVLLGDPGSGKTTLGRWLALQLARGMLDQRPHEVQPVPGSDHPDASRINVPAGTASTFVRTHFVEPADVDRPLEIRIDEAPARGALSLAGRLGDTAGADPSALTAIDAEQTADIGIDVAPARDALSVLGRLEDAARTGGSGARPLRSGDVVRLDQVERLTFTPTDGTCGRGYAQLRYTVLGAPDRARSRTLVIDVSVHIPVPQSQVDPDYAAAAAPQRTVDLGPARVPIFVRLAHFARELAERDRQGLPSLSLEEFLGLDPYSRGRADGLTDAARNAMLRMFLDHGSAVVILDGLDELPEVNRRLVLVKIQEFIEKVTEPNPASRADRPWHSGGNQVVVTSRYVGYKLMPIRSGCAHFGIQQMRRPAVEHFARAWIQAVATELADPRPWAPIAEALIGEIYDEGRPDIRELATNPLLVTILAMVFWADGHLPDQRATLYDRVVENLLAIWLERPECQAQDLQREELLAALEPLAAEMQVDRENNGLIGLDRITELVEGPLAAMRQTSPTNRAFRPVLEAFLLTIRNHVGLLVERSDGNYDFFHRTFQEFLAARHLLSDRAQAAARIVERLDDPLWREPLLLAVGLMMARSEWGGQESRTRLLEELLAADDQDLLIPRAALLVVNALPNLENVPPRIVGQIVERLIRYYAFNQRQSQAERLREEICGVFARLRNRSRADLVSDWIAETIRRSGADPDLAGAASEILRRIGWFTTEMVDALLQVVHRDQAGLGWPVHRALVAALGQSGGQQPWVAPPAAAVNTSRLAASHLPMRRLLESNPGLAAHVRADLDWLWLLIALYGGLGQLEVRDRLRAYQTARVDQLRSTVDDSGPTSAVKGPPLRPIDFSPGDIVHDLVDPGLSRAVILQLRQRRPGRDLADTFRKVWQRGTEPAACAEAVVGLAALGEDIVPLVAAALADPARQAAARATIDRVGWLRWMLREPLIRSTGTAARTVPDEATEDHQLDLLRIVIEARTDAGGGPLPVSDTIPELRLVNATSPAVRDALDAEGWAYLFSGVADEEPNYLGSLLGPALTDDLRARGRLTQGWSTLPQASNHQARPRLPWPQPILASRCDTPVERYLALLDALTTSPPEQDDLAGHLLGRCDPVLDDHPELIWETLAAGYGHRTEFVAAYLAAATDDRLLSSADAVVAARMVARWGPSRSGGDPEQLRAAVETILRSRRESASTIDRAEIAAIMVVMKEAVRIGDPYLMFRAVWRVRVTGVVDNRELLGLVPSITDHHDRARAIEWIMMSIPDPRVAVAVREILELDPVAAGFTHIEDPENRARVLARLALIAPERLDVMLAAALEAVEQIADPVRRAETIGEIRHALGAASDLTAGFEALAGSLPDAWLVDKALGRPSRLIAAYRSQYDIGALAWRLPPEAGARLHRHAQPTGRLAWGLLYLDTTAAEVGALVATPTGDTADWELLLSPQWIDGVDALIDSAADHGLRITTREASVVNRLVQSGRSEVLERLWGLMECADPQAIAIATRWTVADPAAQRWKALVQVESGQLTPDTLDLVVELMATSDDRLRLRGALALHGPTPYTTNVNRRWSVGRVGAETIEAMADHLRRLDHPPFTLSSLQWMRCDTHHDDLDAFTRWLAEAAADPDARAHGILRNIETIDDTLLPPLLDALRSAPPPLQRTLLRALCGIAECNLRFLQGPAEMVRSAIAAVPTEVRRSLSVLPDGPRTLLRIAATTPRTGGIEHRVELARGAAEREMLWLDDACVSTSALCLGRLRTMGDNTYIMIGRNGYWAQAAKAASEFAEDDDVRRLLLAWVESMGMVEDAHDYAHHLLTAISALARISPKVFARDANPDIWEPVLTEWVETGEHWAARQAAVELLGRLRRVTVRVAAPLGAAMKDVSFVQQAAYDCVGEFRSVRGDITDELLPLLHHASAGVAASTARLLVSVARAEGATADRRQIVRGLQAAIVRSARGRNVYLMEENGGLYRVTIQFVDRFDQILYRAIFEVSGE